MAQAAPQAPPRRDSVEPSEQAAFWSQLQPELRRRARAWRLPPQETDEAVDQAWQKAWDSIAEGRRVPRARLRAFLIRVVTNELIDRKRLARNRTSRPLSNEPADPQQGVQQELLRRELHAGLKDCVTALPDRLRGLLSGHYWEERGLSALAREQGVGPSMATKLHKRALGKLFSCMSDKGLAPGGLA